MKISLVLTILLLIFTIGCACPQTPPEPAPTPAPSPAPLPSPAPAPSPSPSPAPAPAPQPAENYALQLADKFCPVIHLNNESEAGENFEPDPVQILIDLSLLRDITDPAFVAKPSISNLQQWSQSDYYLDVAELGPEPNDIEQYKAIYDENKARYPPTVYARVKEGAGATVLQYWLFYYLNDWRNIHEGDWELVQLHFPGGTAEQLLDSNAVPSFAAYSQHQAGQRMPWSEMLDRGLVSGTHPSVYAARGSHANYFTPGQYWSGLDFDDTGLDSWRVISPEQLEVVLLPETADEGSEWLDFQGYWGEYLGFSISVLGLSFGQRGPFGPRWHEGAGPGKKWANPGAWGTGLAEYPQPFWVSLIPIPGDLSKLAIFSIFSPAQLHVYDSVGRHVGVDEKGVLETEIPGSIYIHPAGTGYKTILIPDADVSQEYTLEITGTDTGTAEIKAIVPDAARDAKHYLKYTNVPITPTTKARVQIKPELLVTPERPALSKSVRESDLNLEVDADGDGIFELEGRPGNFEETLIDTFSLWWQEYREPFKLDSSGYSPFYRGAWASRIDEARSYLVNADELRQAGVDTVMLGIDIVFDPDDGEPRSLGDDAFIFYLQALKKAGFRVILVPNPMHPNLDMGKGYEWDEPDPSTAYHRSADLIRKFNAVIIKWAKIAEKYQAEGFAPVNEPSKLVWEYEDASEWLQEALPEIRETYSGTMIALDTMYDPGQGVSIPYPYNYSGYDLILGGPPAGRQDAKNWEEMVGVYINKSNEYVRQYKLDGFGLYEWGGYTGGVWYEDTQMEIFDQVLSEEQAREILEAGIRQSSGRVIASFPRISTGWVDFDTPAFESLAEWYNSLGNPIKPVDDRQWSYQELIIIEKKLAWADHQHIFQIETELTGEIEETSSDQP